MATKGHAQSSANANNAPTPAATTTPVQAPTVSPSPALTTTPSPQPISAPAQTAPTAVPKVIGIDKKRAGLDELITLRVENLPALVQQSKCLAGTPDCQKQEIIIFLDGRPVTGEYPEVIYPEDELVQFHLSRSAGNEDLWGDLLGQPKGFTKPIQVSVGLENGYPLQGAQTLEFIVIHKWGFWSCFLLVAAVLLSILYLGHRTTLLRTSGPKRTDNKLYPYSLGRVQMAFWFVLVVTSFLLIWLITGEYSTISSSALVLIGIGAGTALGATLVDNSKATTIAGQIADYEAEKSVLINRINEIKSYFAVGSNNPPPPQPTGASDLQTELDSKQARLFVVNAMLAQFQTGTEIPPSKGFFNDILVDNGEVTFHRLQIVVWTIVVGIIFVNSVYDRLAMPEFSGTLLALMGISSGTYLGFKGTEK
ncbi:MAG TPA: hypothetical protein VM911_18605 [Pyrinomonadaceae bacterium]|nr:hypothetical protein [Pyrinomonadaceae bacterium]